MSDPVHLEKELSLHSRLLKRAEEMAGVGHWRIDIKNNNSVFWSDEIFRIHGLDKKNGVPSIEDAIKAYHPDDRDFVNNIVAKAIELGENFTFELRIIRPNGDIRYVQSYGECDVDDNGKTEFIFGVFTDITDFKKRELESQEANDALNRIIENIPDFVFVKDNDFRIVEANSAFLSMYPKETRDKVIGTTTLEAYPPEEVKVFTANDRYALDNGYHEAIETVHFPGGEQKTLFTKKVGYQDKNGEKFLLGISRDITEIKETEDKLLQSNIELERFAYIASHDLQEPLRMVRSFTGLLQEEYSDRLDKNGLKYIEFATDAAARMQNLIEDLLQYSRLGVEDQDMHAVDCNKQIRLIKTQLSYAIEKSNATIESQNLPVIHANPVRFSRLLQNLITNAIKYSKDGEPPYVRIRCLEQDTHYEFSVKDNGIGIRSDYHDKIFNIFERLHGKEKYSGTGIGLAICKKIIDSIGGDIWFNSIENKGTTFYFTIPKYNNKAVEKDTNNATK